MPRKGNQAARQAVVKEESWSSFHKKHHSPEFFWSPCAGSVVKKQCYCPALPLCMTDQEDGEEEGWHWIADFFEMFDTATHSSSKQQQQANKLRKIMSSDDDSYSSAGESNSLVKNKKRNMFLRKNSSKRKGNVKLQNLSYR